MVKAVFLDFYGTVVYEDNGIIREITKRVFLSGKEQNAVEIGLFWRREYEEMTAGAHGAAFRTQRDGFESLKNTINRFESTENAVALSQMMYDQWTSRRFSGSQSASLSFVPYLFI